MDGEVDQAIDAATGLSLPGRLPSLTGMRAVAAFAVFLSHLKWVFGSASLLHIGGQTLTTDGMLEWGARGVTFFFVLSGFVLSWTLDGPPDRGRFYRRRLARIWPSNAAMWAVFIVLGAAGVAAKTGPLAALAALLLVQTWIPGLGWANAVNPVAWTLSCELFFYLAFPFLFGWIRPLQRRGLALAGLVTLGVGGLITFGYLAPQRIVVSTFPPFRIYEFILGIVLALAVRRGLVRWAPSLLVSLGVLALAMATADLERPLNGLGSFVPVVVSVLVVARLALVDLGVVERNRVSRGWLGARTGELLGEYSFAFYLVQLAPLALLDHWCVRPTGAVGQVAWSFLWFGATIVAAVVLHRAVERPGVRRFARGRGTGSVEVAGGPSHRAR